MTGTLFGSVLLAVLMLTTSSIAATLVPGGGGGFTSLGNYPDICGADEMIVRNGTDTENVCAANLSGGAGTGLSYITKTAEGTLSNEFALGSLTTGLIINTTTTGIPTILAAQSCAPTNQFVRGYSASGTATCNSIADADVPDTVSVTGWTMGASVATKPAVDDDDTSLATTEWVQDETAAAGIISGTLGTGFTVDDGEIVENDLAASLAFDDGDVLDFSAVSITAATDGILLPRHATDCSSATAEGQVCWDVDTNHLWVGDGVAAVDIGPGTGGASNSFATQNVADEDPVADSPTDTLSWTTNTGITFTGNETTDTIAVELDQDLVDLADGTLTVGAGGSGAQTFTDGGILLGSGTGAFTALGVATNGQIPIGDGTTDPVLAAPTSGDATEITVTLGAGTIAVDIPTNPVLDGSLTIGGALDGATTGDFDGAVTAPSFAADPSATPKVEMTKDTADDEVSLEFAVTCSDDATTTEDCGYTIGSKKAGTLTNSIAVSDTGGITLTAPISTGTAALVVATGAIDSTEVLDDTLTFSDLAASLTPANGDLIDFGTNISSATEGLFLPAHATACTTATAEGQVCWEEDANILWVGDGVAPVQVGPGAGAPALSAVTAATAPATIDNAENAIIWGWDTAAAAASPKDAFTFNFTDDSTSGGGAQSALVVARPASTGTATVEDLLRLENLDTDGAVTNGIRFNAAAGLITTAINMNDAQITNAFTTPAQTITIAELDTLDATSSIQTQINTKAPLASPTFTGTVGLPSGQALTSPSITTSILSASASFDAFNTTATTLNVGGAATTMTVGGTPTTAITHNYSTNATATATTKTVNLGTGGAAGSTSNVNIGDADGGTTTITSPTLTTSATTGIGFTTSATECVYLDAGAAIVKSTDTATSATVDGTNFAYKVWDLRDITGDENIYWNYGLPKNIVGTTATVEVEWMTATCTTTTADDLCLYWNGGGFQEADTYGTGALSGTIAAFQDSCVTADATGPVLKTTDATSWTHGYDITGVKDSQAVFKLSRDVTLANAGCAGDNNDIAADVRIRGVRICYEVDNVASGEN